ncbi:MAG: signal transduction histidine kinase [Candidatus Azotimanducaceae bacterium]|jgi:signal transduction histidine kinase
MDLTTLLASAIHDVKNQLHMLAPDLNDLAESSDLTTRSAAQSIAYRVGAVDRSLVRLLVLYRFSVASGSVPVTISEIYVSDLLNSLPYISSGSDYGEFGKEPDFAQQDRKDNKKLSTEIKCDQQLMGYFDESLVSTVLRDALDNARRFAKSKIVISATNEQGGTRFVIEDDGVGPDVALEEPQFEPGSTGLGLYLARCVAEAHSKNECLGYARLQKSSSLGGGEFTLFLP